MTETRIPLGGEAYAAGALEGMLVDITTISPHPSNPRNGDTDLIVESIRENWLYRPVYVQKSTGHILAGNHTYASLIELGAGKIPVVWLDVDDTRAAKILLVDNKSADSGGYDTGLLAQILDDLGYDDLAGTGYDADDLDNLLATTELPDAIGLPSEGQNTGTAASMDIMSWGYLQWKSTRVQITADEVTKLDSLFNDYVVEKGTPAGFGWFLMDQAHALEGQA